MKILSKIKPINGADFKIADAKDIAIGDSDVEEKINKMNESILLRNKNLDSKFNLLQNHKLEWVNVKSLGAGEGGDDTQIIQDCLDSYNTVYLPKGIYSVNNIKLNSYNVLLGDGKATVLKYSKNNNDTTKENYVINIKNDSSLCEIRNLTLDGGNSSVICGGISCDDKSKTTKVFDTSHILENLQIINFNGNGIYIGKEVRGCKLKDIKILDVKGYGVYLKGTDNMLLHSSVGQIGKSGIVVSQNNRIVSCKPFLCGLQRDAKYWGIELLENYNDLVNVAIQQNECNGLRICGYGNNIDFNSDGIGTNNKDNSANISVIEFEKNANSNNIRGTISQGTLNGFFNYLLYFDEPLGQVNNIINLAFHNSITSLIDVKYTNSKTIHPSNRIQINGLLINGYELQNNIMTEDSKPFAIYSGHLSYDTPITQSNGSYNYDFPVKITDCSLKGGCAFRFPLKIGESTKYLACSYKIESNLENSTSFSYNAYLYNSNLETGVRSPIILGYGFNKGYYTSVFDVSNIKNDELSYLAFGVFKQDNNTDPKTVPSKVTLGLSDLFVSMY